MFSFSIGCIYFFVAGNSWTETNEKGLKIIRNDTVTAFVGVDWAALHIQVLATVQKMTQVQATIGSTV